MKLTVQVKLMPTREQESIIKETLVGYIRTVNDLVAEFVILGELKNKTSADVQGSLPSALKAQAIRDARSVFQKYRKELFKAKKHVSPEGKTKNVKVPILKKPVAIWNNQNFSVGEGTLAFPLWINGKVTRTAIKAVIPERQKSLPWPSPIVAKSGSSATGGRTNIKSEWLEPSGKPLAKPRS